MSPHGGEADEGEDRAPCRLVTLNGRWVAACAAGCWPFSPPARHKVLGFRD
jgi:hypothetical protein